MMDVMNFRLSLIKQCEHHSTYLLDDDTSKWILYVYPSQILRLMPFSVFEQSFPYDVVRFIADHVSESLWGVHVEVIPHLLLKTA